MIDLQAISRLLDAALAQETTASVDAFLAAHPDPGAEPAVAAGTELFEGFIGTATTTPLHTVNGSMKSGGQGAYLREAPIGSMAAGAGNYSYAMAA